MEGAQQLQNLYVVEEEAAAVIIFLVRKLLVVGKDGEEMTKIASFCMEMLSWYFFLNEGLFGLSRTMLRLMCLNLTRRLTFLRGNQTEIFSSKRKFTLFCYLWLKFVMAWVVRARYHLMCFYYVVPLILKNIYFFKFK